MCHFQYYIILHYEQIRKINLCICDTNLACTASIMQQPITWYPSGINRYKPVNFAIVAQPTRTLALCAAPEILQLWGVF